MLLAQAALPTPDLLRRLGVTWAAFFTLIGGPIAYQTFDPWEQVLCAPFVKALSPSSHACQRLVCGQLLCCELPALAAPHRGALGGLLPRSVHAPLLERLSSSAAPPQPLEFCLSAGLGSLLVVAVAVLRIYLGWAYVGDRLLSAAARDPFSQRHATSCAIIFAYGAAASAERTLEPCNSASLFEDLRARIVLMPGRTHGWTIGLAQPTVRFHARQVEYEETGWYDGQVFVKPPEVLARDRLLGSYEVRQQGCCAAPGDAAYARHTCCDAGVDGPAELLRATARCGRARDAGVKAHPHPTRCALNRSPLRLRIRTTQVARVTRC